MRSQDSLRAVSEEMNCGGGQCKETGVWAPVIVTWAKGYRKDSHEPLRMYVGITVCESCRQKMDDIKNFLLPEGKEKIRSAMAVMGKAEPDLDTAVLEWDLIPPDVKDIFAYVMAQDGRRNKLPN